MSSNNALRLVAPLAGAAFLIATAFAVTTGPAQAKKCYAEATGFPCKKCHNNPAGGKEDGWNAYGMKYKKKVVEAGKAPC